MVHLDLVVGREIQPVELVGQHEDALLHVFEFQVGFHQLVVQGIFLILVFLGVIGPVPRHQLSLETERSGVVAHRAVVGVGIGLGRGQQFREEVVDRFRILGHAAFEHVIGIALVAQQVGDLQTRIGDFLHDLRVVELAAQRPRIAGFPEFLLQFAVRGIGHKRQVAGMLQRHGPALLAAGLGLGGHAFADECGQLGHHLRIGDVERECVGRGQRVLPEPERQPREFGGVLAVKLLVGVGKGRAAASETLIGVLEQFPVLFAKTSRMLVDLFHPGEQLGIERDVVRQFGQLGLHALCDLLHFVRRVGFEQVEEKPRDAVEQLALTLQRHDRIAEGGFPGVVHDRVDLGARAGDRGIERRFVVREFYLGERRGLMGRLPCGQQGIRQIEFGQLRFGDRIVGAACRHSGNGHNKQYFFHYHIKLAVSFPMGSSFSFPGRRMPFRRRERRPRRTVRVHSEAPGREASPACRGPCRGSRGTWSCHPPSRRGRGSCGGNRRRSSC